jgi:hypothetical protein
MRYICKVKAKYTFNGRIYLLTGSAVPDRIAVAVVLFGRETRVIEINVAGRSILYDYLSQVVQVFQTGRGVLNKYACKKLIIKKFTILNCFKLLNLYWLQLELVA